MPSPELARVIDHLQGLAAEVGAAVDIEGARRVLNRFGDCTQRCVTLTQMCFL